MARSLLGGLILGALGVALQLFLQKTLTPEDYQSLMGGGSTYDRESGAPSGRPRVNVVDDSEIPTAGLYSDTSAQEGYANSRQQDAGMDQAVLRKESSAEDTSGGFQEMRFGSSGGSSDDSGSASYEEGLAQPSPNVTQAEVIKEDIQKIRNSARESSNGEVRFKSGGKVINTDPKIVARAIQTVLKRDQ